MAKKESKEINEILSLLNKKFKRNVVSMVNNTHLECKRISSGVFALDIALGGGFPTNSINEIYGEKSSGKSFVCLMACAEQTKLGKYVAWVDIENTFDISWAKKVGIDTDYLVISQPATAEEAGDILDTFVRSGKFAIVVLDSIGALAPQVEIETSLEQQQMGVGARVLNKLMRKLHSALQPVDLMDEEQYNQTTVLMINQVREKIGIMYGSPETTPGGRGHDFANKTVIRIKAGEKIKNKKSDSDDVTIVVGEEFDKDDIIGQTAKFKINKNKTAPPLKTGEFNIYYNGKIDNLSAVIAESLKHGLIKQSGAFFSIEDNKFQGRAKLEKYIIENQLLDSFKDKILKIIEDKK